MTSSSTKTTHLPADVKVLLHRLRWWIRWYVLADGLSGILIALGSAFWVGLAIDWLFEPSPPIRVAALVAVAILVLVIACRLIGRRIRVPFPDSSLALLIERKHGSFRESLLTAVEFAQPDASISASRIMLGQTVDQARSLINSVRLARIFNFRPLVIRLAAVGFLIASVVVFGLLKSAAFDFWLRRIALTEALWPRRVALAVDGFLVNVAGRRVECIAQDDTYDLTVRASLEDAHQAPAEVEIRYRMKDGQRGRDILKQIGLAIPGRDTEQIYQYKFKNIASDLDFDIIGGDDRIDDLHLDVVDRPNLANMRFHCAYPAYMDRPKETLDITGTMSIPEGATLELVAEATKPLIEARLYTADSSDDQVLHFSAQEDGRDVSFLLPPIGDDTVFLISLTDRDGVRTRDPIRVAIAITQDTPPEVAVRLHGIGMAVTPDARIPFTGTITDPRYAMDRCWFVLQAGPKDPQTIPFSAIVDGQQEIRVNEVLDARMIDANTKQRVLELTPGEQLVIRVMASDRYDLTERAHEGSSQPFTLDIVTPDQLRALLEQRELSLRQRFEALIDKTTDTRRLLELLYTDEQSVHERHQFRMIAAQQNMAQVAQEILGIAESFDLIQSELINNRVDTPEMLDRLHNDIAEPLRQIALQQIPNLQKHLDMVQLTMDRREDGTNELKVGVAMTDDILVAMRQVLDKMTELENFNEVLDLIRRMIEDQETLNEKTKKRQREQLRKL
ncbi:MAG: hypothetical protein JW829_16660 [Pirellulales bacterium]|nr:hypothetical protein [Pirellulales bacterium]